MTDTAQALARVERIDAAVKNGFVGEPFDHSHWPFLRDCIRSLCTDIEERDRLVLD